MHLVPQQLGPELYSLDPNTGAKAFSGTGFDPGNEQHSRGSDAVRYAIAIQQLRDQQDYAGSDAARKMAESLGFFVMQERGAVRVKAKPPLFDRWPSAKRKAFRLESHEMPVSDGIIYDTKAAGGF